MKKKFAFISRHVPTAGQVELAARASVELVHVGDRDGFTVDPTEFDGFDGVVAVHLAAGLNCFGRGLAVGVFNNVNRAPVGQPPQFHATALHIYAVGDYAPEEGYVVPMNHIVIE